MQAPSRSLKNGKPPQIQEKINCKRKKLEGHLERVIPEMGRRGPQWGCRMGQGGGYWAGPKALGTWVTDRKESRWRRETREAQGRPHPGQVDRKMGVGRTGEGREK